MNRFLALGLLALGCVLVVSGISAAKSIGPEASLAGHASSADRTIGLLVGGVITSVVGLAGFIRQPRS